MLPRILDEAAQEPEFLGAKPGPPGSLFVPHLVLGALQALMEHARLSTPRLSGRLPETSGRAGCLQAKRGSAAKQTATLLLLPRDTALGPWLTFGESFETQDVWNKIFVIQ